MYTASLSIVMTDHTKISNDQKKHDLFEVSESSGYKNLKLAEN